MKVRTVCEYDDLPLEPFALARIVGEILVRKHKSRESYFADIKHDHQTSM
jgi:hypothetical protein